MDILGLQTCRVAFAQARNSLVAAQYHFETASSALLESQRVCGTGTAELAASELAKVTAANSLAQARTNETAAKNALQQALDQWLYQGNITPNSDLSRLNGGQPIVLFPLRVETRFDGNSLKVRVFPDEILQSTHETALTTEEHAAAKTYYERLNEEGKEQELWRDLVARFGVQRSAYLLRIMLPVFGGGGWGTTTSGSTDCCSALTGANHDTLAFPTDVPLRSGSWTRAGEAVLPDRWVVVTYRNGKKTTHKGSRVIEPLACTLNPSAADTQKSALENGEFYIDDDIRWTVDFERAREVGMGIQIDGLTAAEVATDGSGGFDRIIVLGVKTSMSDVETSAHIERLFDAHHYTRGLAIIRQGTPTNNIETQPTSYPPKENAGEDSYVTERKYPPLNRYEATHCLPENSDGYALARMLGVPSGVFANVDRGREKEIHRARQMNRVLWPGTLGYFMRTMMDPVFDEADIGIAQDWFVNHVIARGPAPAFRVGATPYGVLPIASLKTWTATSTANSSNNQVEAALLKPLQALKEIWLDVVPQVPKVSETSNDPDGDLARILALHPSARELRVRRGLGETTQWSVFSLFGWDFRYYWDRYSDLTRQLFTRLGLPLLQPRIGRIYFKDHAHRFTGAWVMGKSRENRTLSDYGSNFIYGLINASPTDLNSNNSINILGAPSALYALLRHSTLAEYARIVNAILVPQAWKEQELWWLPSFNGEFPKAITWYFSGREALIKTYAATHLAALGALADASTAELERLLTETLDLTSHRIDAWITAFGYRRILDRRQEQEDGFMKFCGDYFGGYGVVENVRPRLKKYRTLADGGSAEVQVGSGGFIHTPSMTHAAAAAILRSAHLSYRHLEPKRYAIDLSSRRVRAGRNLLDGVRSGQPVGALLGYQFERGLRDGGYSPDFKLDEVRFRLRELYPLVAKKDGTDSTESAETIAARNVVDGLRLLRAYSENAIPFDVDAILPDVGTAPCMAVIREIDKMRDALDGATDLVNSEAVFQFARGNVNAAVPAMQNAVRGQPVADPAVIHSARGGIGIAHRVAWVFPGETPTETEDPLPLLGWPATRSPRAAAEPVLDIWFGQLVGAPDNVKCAVEYLDLAGTVMQSVEVSLAELELRPLDMLALAQAIVQSHQGALLDRRVVAAATSKNPATDVATYRVNYEVVGSRTFPQIIEVAGAVNAVLGSSRALKVSDLLSPSEVAEGLELAEATAVTASAEIVGRALAAKETLSLTAQAVAQAALVAQSVADADSFTAEERATILSALVETAKITAVNAYPSPTDTGAELVLAVVAAKTELNRRLAGIPSELGVTGVSTTMVDVAIAALKAVFGDNFVALPQVVPPRPQELELSLSARPTLLPGNPEAADRYLQQLTRVRARLSRWRKLSLYARSLGAKRPRLEVVQLPHVPGERWLGLPFEANQQPEGGRAALLLLTQATTLDATATWTGIVLDDWTEIIPNRKEQTGIAVHYDGPSAQAPQTILVAANSEIGSWTFDGLLASVEQTIDLAKVRAVDSELVDLGQVLPANVMGQNRQVLRSLSTVWAGLRQGVNYLGLKS